MWQEEGEGVKAVEEGGCKESPPRRCSRRRRTFSDTINDKENKLEVFNQHHN